MSSLHSAHPPSLRIFFATELWERYGFYVVQTLLALYLALHFHWQDKDVYTLVASFTALTYLSPVIGGWIADHLLGQKRAIITGAVVLCISYIAISFIEHTQALTAALAGIAVGTGLLKPNISSLLGNEYPVGSPHRESGFTIFYMGLTTGILLGTTLPSTINYYYGWSSSFMSAAIGLIIAILTFVYGIQRYHIKDYQPYHYQFKKCVLAALIMFVLWLLSFYVLNFPSLANRVFLVVVLLSLSYLLYSSNIEQGMQSRQTLVIALLCIISVVFWAFYFQMFLSLTLFISRVVQPTLWGITLTPPCYVGIQSLGMILVGFLISRHKRQATQSQRGIITGNKFIYAMILMTIAYTIITLAAHFSFYSLLLSPLYIIPAYLMISVAELLLSPVGLSAITTLASPKKVSTMMGIFFVSLGIGGFLSGKLANLTAIPAIDMSIMDIKIHYSHSFFNLLFILFITTLICIILNVIIKRLMSNPTLITEE